MAEEKTIIINVETGNAEKDIQNINNEIKKVDNQAKSTSKGFGNLGGQIDKVTGGAASKFGSFRKAIGGVTTGFKSLRVAIISTGIGALLIAITSIIQAFKRSEEGQNKFAKLLGVIGSVVNNLLDVLGDLGDLLISAFENPQKAISDFANLIKENITNRFEGLLELIPNLGKAISLLFKGEFAEAGKVAADAVGKVTLGVDSITESTQNAINKTKEFIAELEREAKIAAQIADQRAQAEKLERGLIVETAEAERRIAELRDRAARSDLFSLSERKAALIEASEINERITNQQIEAAKLRRDAIIEENKLSSSNKDALKEEEEAKAAVIRLESQRLRLQKRLGTELASLNNQEVARANAAAKKAETENAKIEANEQKRLQSIAKIRQKFITEQENLEDQTEEQKLARQRERAQAELDQLVGTETEKRQAQIELNDFFDSKEIELRDKKNKELEQKNKESREREEAEKEKIRQQDLKREELKESAKISLQENAFKLASELAEEGSAASKAIQVAQTIMQTIQGTQAAFTTAQKNPITATFPAYPFIQAGIAGAFGALSVKKILSTPVKTTNAGAVSSGTPSSGGGAETPAPAFNLIGQAGGVNQIEEGLQQEQTPIQAFVVSGDVSSAQELDRNIIDSATIG